MARITLLSWIFLLLTIISYCNSQRQFAGQGSLIGMPSSRRFQDSIPGGGAMLPFPWHAGLPGLPRQPVDTRVRPAGYRGNYNTHSRRQGRDTSILRRPHRDSNSFVGVIGRRHKRVRRQTHTTSGKAAPAWQSFPTRRERKTVLIDPTHTQADPSMLFSTFHYKALIDQSNNPHNSIDSKSSGSFGTRERSGTQSGRAKSSETKSQPGLNKTMIHSITGQRPDQIMDLQSQHVHHTQRKHTDAPYTPMVYPTTSKPVQRSSHQQRGRSHQSAAWQHAPEHHQISQNPMPHASHLPKSFHHSEKSVGMQHQPLNTVMYTERTPAHQVSGSKHYPHGVQQQHHSINNHHNNAPTPTPHSPYPGHSQQSHGDFQHQTFPKQPSHNRPQHQLRSPQSHPQHNHRGFPTTPATHQSSNVQRTRKITVDHPTIHRSTKGSNPSSHRHNQPYTDPNYPYHSPGHKLQYQFPINSTFAKPPPNQSHFQQTPISKSPSHNTLDKPRFVEHKPIMHASPGHQAPVSHSQPSKHSGQHASPHGQGHRAPVSHSQPSKHSSQHASPHGQGHRAPVSHNQPSKHSGQHASPHGQGHQAPVSHNQPSKHSGQHASPHGEGHQAPVSHNQPSKHSGQHASPHSPGHQAPVSHNQPSKNSGQHASPHSPEYQAPVSHNQPSKHSGQHASPHNPTMDRTYPPSQSQHQSSHMTQHQQPANFPRHSTDRHHIASSNSHHTSSQHGPKPSGKQALHIPRHLDRHSPQHSGQHAQQTLSRQRFQPSEKRGTSQGQNNISQSANPPYYNSHHIDPYRVNQPSHRHFNPKSEYIPQTIEPRHRDDDLHRSRQQPQNSNQHSYPIATQRPHTEQFPHEQRHSQQLSDHRRNSPNSAAHVQHGKQNYSNQFHTTPIRESHLKTPPRHQSHQAQPVEDHHFGRHAQQTPQATASGFHGEHQKLNQQQSFHPNSQFNKQQHHQAQQQTRHQDRFKPNHGKGITIHKSNSTNNRDSNNILDKLYSLTLDLANSIKPKGTLPKQNENSHNLPIQKPTSNNQPTSDIKSELGIMFRKLQTVMENLKIIPINTVDRKSTPAPLVTTPSQRRRDHTQRQSSLPKTHQQKKSMSPLERTRQEALSNVQASLRALGIPVLIDTNHFGPGDISTTPSPVNTWKTRPNLKHNVLRNPAVNKGTPQSTKINNTQSTQAPFQTMNLWKPGPKTVASGPKSKPRGEVVHNVLTGMHTDLPNNKNDRWQQPRGSGRRFAGRRIVKTSLMKGGERRVQEVIYTPYPPTVIPDTYIPVDVGSQTTPQPDMSSQNQGMRPVKKSGSGNPNKKSLKTSTTPPKTTLSPLQVQNELNKNFDLYKFLDFFKTRLDQQNVSSTKDQKRNKTINITKTVKTIKKPAKTTVAPVTAAKPQTKPGKHPALLDVLTLGSPFAFDLGQQIDIISPTGMPAQSGKSSLNATQAAEILKLLEALQTLKNAIGHSGNSGGTGKNVDLGFGLHPTPTVKIVLQMSDLDNRHKGKCKCFPKEDRCPADLKEEPLLDMCDVKKSTPCCEDGSREDKEVTMTLMDMLIGHQRLVVRVF